MIFVVHYDSTTGKEGKQGCNSCVSELVNRFWWEDNIKEWTIMDLASSTRAAENRARWKGIVVNSSVVPRRPSKVMG